MISVLHKTDRFIRYMECVASMPPETPLAYGLHPNTEIGYRTQQCEDLFKTLMESEGASSGATANKGGVEIEGEAVRRFTSSA